MSELNIRPATFGDVPLLLQLVRELAEYEKLLHEVVASHADFEAALFGEQRNVEAVIAEWDGKPAGMALFFYNFSTFVGRRGLYLEDLFVRPALRGKGIGKALLTHLAREAKRRGCGRLEWAVLDWNESALGFYKRLGARIMDDWRICRLDGEALDEAAAR